MTITGDMHEVTCPECGTVSHFAQMRKAAEEFCRRCDYPLFWVRRTLGAGDGGVGEGDTGLRRLPGAGGWQDHVVATCPSCSEPNRFDATVCVRCGADMHPAPPPPPPAPAPLPPPPPPAPAPPPPPRRWWPLVLLVAAIVLAVLGVVAWLVL